MVKCYCIEKGPHGGGRGDGESSCIVRSQMLRYHLPMTTEEGSRPLCDVHFVSESVWFSPEPPWEF